MSALTIDHFVPSSICWSDMLRPTCVTGNEEGAPMELYKTGSDIKYD